MPQSVVAIIAAAFAVAIGFACGALLSKPSIETTDARINAVEESNQKLMKETEKVKETLDTEQNKNARLTRSIKKLEQENEKIIWRATQLENEKSILLDKVSELEKLKEKLIEKALR